MFRSGFRPVATIRVEIPVLAQSQVTERSDLGLESALAVPRAAALQGVATSPSIGMLCVTPRWGRNVPGARLRLPEKLAA